MHIGAKIRRWRKRAGLSQYDLARKAGLAESHVGLLERGNVENPSLATVVSIAGALAIGLDDLVFGAPKPLAGSQATAGAENEAA